MLPDFLLSVGDSLKEVLANIGFLLPNLIIVAIIIAAIFIAYSFLTKTITRAVNSTIRKEDEREAVLKIWRYGFLLIAILVFLLSFSGSFAAAGLSLGLLSAALGWTLQKPITGIAAWLMILVKKPFKVGDRVIIDGIKGDIQDITVFYIVLKEFGGTIVGEESSGRTIMVPTSVLFDQAITNYTLGDVYILDEVCAEYTYESDLAKAEETMIEAAKKFTHDVIKSKGKEPFTRVFLNPSGVNVKVRYFVSAKKREEIMSNITREIYNMTMKAAGVEFAYPHTKVVFNEKPKE